MDHPELISNQKEESIILYLNSSMAIEDFGSNCHLRLTFCILGTLANSEDSDEMPHNAAFHQGIHCLPRQKRFSEKNTISFENYNL